MADPTQAEVETYWKAVVDVLEDDRASADGTIVGNLNTAQQAMEGDYVAVMGAASLATWRGVRSGALTRDAAAAMLTPVVHEYAKFIASPGAGRDLGRCLADLYVYWKENNRTLKSRNISYASGSMGGSNAGNGSLSRLTVDENNYRLEGCYVEAKKLKCIKDAATGARRHAEKFDLYGVEGSIDSLDVVNHGSGDRVEVYSHHAGGGDGGSLLRNSSFSEYNSAGTVTTKFPGWTIDTLGNVTTSANYFRGFPGSAENTTGGPSDLSMDITNNVVVYQRLTDAGITLDPALPYFLRVMLRRRSSATGTFTLRFGGQNVTQALSGLTNDVWTELLITVGQKNWPKYVDEQNLDISLELASYGGSGSLEVDDVLFAPFDMFDGTWWFLRGGSTPWLLDDSWSGTDTGGAAADAKLQYWLQWAFRGFYLPSTTGTPTVSDP